MEFCVVRSKRRTLSLSVEKNGEILVRSPASVSDQTIRDFVMRHERWIASRLEKRKSFKTLSLRNGDVLRLFGEDYEIEEGEPRLCDGRIYLPLLGRERALLAIVKTLSERKMSKIVNEIARRYGFEYSLVRISAARRRWGSCSKKGVLSFTCFLSFTDPALARYVAVHELCHTRYFHHQKLFWREVERVLPDWRTLRARLKSEENCLEYLRYDLG